MTDNHEVDGFSMTRFMCDCLEPEHALDICVERHASGLVVRVSVEMYMCRDLPWRNRLRMLWDVIRNRRVLLAETVIPPRDWGAFAECSNWLLRASEQTKTS